MKILIGIDESPQSKQALDFVGRMRWPAGSRVIVVSALQPKLTVATASPDLSVSLAQFVEDERREVEELVSRAEGWLREAGFATEGRVEVGDPREALIAVAQRERADLMVVGSHGRAGLAKFVLGSVSSHVVTHAPCSVLVVKQDAATARRAGKS
jgi:nucleotide-binding universal stress UspA family protein